RGCRAVAAGTLGTGRAIGAWPATHTMRSTRVCLLLIVGLAVAGAYVSGSLLVGHGGGWNADRSGDGFLLRSCASAAHPSVSCPEVIGSRFGSFDFAIAGRRVLVPTSLIGLAYFTTIALWFTLVGPAPGGDRRLRSVTMLLVSGGLAGSMFLTGLMAFSLSHWCPPCILAHVLNAGVFGLSLWHRRVSRRAAADRAWSGVTMSPRVWPGGQRAVWAVGLAGACTVGFWLYFDARMEVRRQWRKLAATRSVIETMQGDAAMMMREYLAQPVVEAASRPASHRQRAAPESASSARLVIFTKDDCPACACFEKTRLPRIVAALGGRLHVERHDVGGRAGSPDGQNDAASPQEAADTRLAAALGVTRVPALFLDGRRVPDLCAGSAAFWEAVAKRTRSDEVIGHASAGGR
ncbi:MAG: vitamin K epoxide reductase family protein, partial [Phycisphaerae bacterium]